MEFDGVNVEQRLRGRQARTLLVYLVVNRQRLISRQELIGALWPGESPASEDAALRTLLSRVRSAIGAEALTGRDELSLNLPEPVWVDVEAASVELQRAVRALAQADARTAWAAAQVPLNIAGRGLAPGIQAPWLDAVRTELEETRLEALEVIGGAGLIMGGAQLASVERAGRMLIDADPYRESGYLLLMQAAARRGNPAAAVRVFERLRALMREELGTTPSAEAIAVYERLLEPHAAESPASGVSVGLRPAPVELPIELQSRTGGELVGRRSEREELSRLWAGACRGERRPVVPGTGAQARRVVVLVGDAGIGKTTLAIKLAEQAHAEGGVVLAGRAAEEGLAPYQPFLEAVRQYFASADLDELGMAIREYGPELARLVPEIHRRLPDLAPPRAAEPDAERYRLFEAVVGLLSAISERAPILLLLDDLHWADRATLLLLRHLARSPAPVRLLILVSYRSEPIAEGLRDLLDDLDREKLVTRVQIGGLSERETAELVRLRTEENPSQSLVTALHEATEGNPLFIEEIVRNLVGSGVDVATAHAAVLHDFALPAGVKRMIARRIEQLDPRTNQWLRVASVIGREFDLSLLDRVLEMPEDELLGALEEALAAGVVVESEPGHYSFAHALIRDALYEGMSGARRTRMHRRVGEALEQGGNPSLSELARHFTLAAGPADVEKAIRYALQAAEEANRALAHEEAAEHYGRALEVLERFSPEAETQRLELLLRLAEARVKAGERALVLSVAQAAADLAERLADPAGMARAAICASRRYVQQPGVVEPDVIALLERALAKTAGEVSVDRVKLLSRLCGAIYYSPERGRCSDLAEEAIDTARELENPEAFVYAYSAARRSVWDAGHLKQRLECSTQMLHWALRTGDLELELQARAFIAIDLLESGDRDAADAEIAAFSEGAARALQPLYRWNALLWRATQALMAGRLDEAEAASTQAEASGAPAEAVTAPLFHDAQMWAIRREQGRFAAVESAVRARVELHPTRPGWRALLGILLWETGRSEEAAQQLRRLAEHEFEDLAPDGDWLSTLALIGELCVGLQDTERGARVHELMAPYAGVNVLAGHATVCLGSAGRYVGNLAWILGRSEEAAQRLELAVKVNHRLHAPVLAAHAQLDLARALGGGARASRLIDDAAQIARELGVGRLAERARRLARH